MSYYQSVSPKAKTVIESQGGTVVSKGNGYDVQFPTGTEALEGLDHGGWGNLSIRQWKTPNGQTLVWDSEDHQLQRGYDR